MTEYKGNLKVGDYIKVITDKSKYFENVGTLILKDDDDE